MVLSVCRRILGDPHDAEDAFQATFLILATRAQSIPGAGVGRELAAWRRPPGRVAAPGHDGAEKG